MARLVVLISASLSLNFKHKDHHVQVTFHIGPLAIVYDYCWVALYFNLTLFQVGHSHWGDDRDFPCWGPACLCASTWWLFAVCCQNYIQVYFTICSLWNPSFSWISIACWWFAVDTFIFFTFHFSQSERTVLWTQSLLGSSWRPRIRPETRGSSSPSSGFCWQVFINLASLGVHNNKVFQLFWGEKLENAGLGEIQVILIERVEILFYF